MAAIEEVLNSMHLFLGPNNAAFEEEFADYCGTRGCVTVGNGTDALHLALRAADIGPGDEVITVAHTFFATTEAIVLAGATPVFVDIQPDTYLIDPDLIEARITSRTKAILPVHLYGQMADMDPIMDIAARHNLVVIEDAAEAHGAEYRGRRAGSIGHLGCFSFYYSKNLGAYGEAGAIVGSDPHLMQRVAAAARPWVRTALSPPGDWLQLAHGRDSGGDPARQAAASGRVESSAPRARRDVCADAGPSWPRVTAGWGRP